jgi:hypothetical protein
MLFANNEKAKSTPGFNRLKKIARAGSQVKPMLGGRLRRRMDHSCNMLAKA